jgi:hypothetical protein
VSNSRNIEEFERCWPWIEAAMAYEVGGAAFGKSDVWSSIERDDYQFWPRVRSAGVTSIVETPVRKFLHVLWLGGNGLDIVDGLEPVLDAYGRAHGCSYIVGSGRTGWIKLLKKKQYEEVARIYAKQLARE